MRSESIVVFLYQQLGATATNTNLSLIVVNDIAQDGTGGASTLRLTLTDGTGGPLGTTSIAIRDDSTDRYNASLLASGILTSSWNWSPCCTDGLALAGLPTTSDFCASFQFSGLQGISQILVGSQDLNGDEEVTAAPISQSFSICGKNCTNTCVQHTVCGTCMADPNCGWCTDSGVCVPGSSQGPDQGQCRDWRYSYTQSRVLSEEPGFPVSPSNVEYFLNASQLAPLTVEFSVRVPDPDDVPLEVLILQDISSVFATDLSLLRASVVSTYLSILDTYPAARLSVGAFSDKPVSPYGSPTLPDPAYSIRMSLSNDLTQIQTALNSLTVASGGDEPNSQLEALFYAAKRLDVGWTDNSRKVVMLITKSSYHIPVADSRLSDNDGDSIDGGSPAGSTENYPSVPQVRSALLANNIIPIFLTTPELSGIYQGLVNQLGFGFVTTFTTLNSQSIFSQSLQVLQTLGGFVQPVISTQGDIQGTITPSQYSGVSFNTRVSFTVSLSDTSSQDATIVVPGFGSISLSQVATDNPVAASQSDVTILDNNDVVLQLSGTSIYNSVLSTVITQLPAGRTFQFNDGSRGTELTGLPPYQVSDPNGRVVFNANGLAGTSTIQYFLKDDCDACSTYASFRVITSLPKSLPQATPGTASTPEDTPTPISLSGTTSYPGTLTTIVISLPTGGQLFDGATQITTVPYTVPSAVVTYYPALHQYGAESAGFLYDQFDFTVSDSAGQATQSATVLIYVTPVPHNPVANNVTSSTLEDQVATFTLDASDIDGDTLTYIVDSISGGSICVGSVSSCSWTNTVPFSTSTPTINFRAGPNNNGVFTITYHAQDQTSRSSNSAIVTVTVTPVNDLPVAAAGADNTDENTPKTFSLSYSDIDNTFAQLGVVICSWNGPGTLRDSQGNVIPYTSSPYNLPVGSNAVQFTPATNSYGLTSFSFAARDLEGPSPCVTFTITVNFVNQAPQSFSDSVSVLTNQQSAITIRGYDVDTPTLSFYLCNGPVKGSLVNNDGSAINQVITGVTGATATVKYTPVGFEFGPGYATFSFKVGDGQYNTTCSTVTINVLSVQATPVTNNPSPFPVTLSENTVQVVTLSCTDPNGDTVTYSIESPLPSSSQVVLAEVSTNQNIVTPRSIQGNQIRIQPAQYWYGATQFTYSCTDGNNTATATIPVTVTFVNQPSTAFDQYVVTDENVDKIITLTGSDIENVTVSFQIQNTVTRGTLLICSDSVCSSTTGTASSGSPVPSGTVKFQPVAFTNDNHTGVYTSFSFFAIDTFSAPSTTAGVVTIGVNLINYPPQANTPNSTVVAPYNQDITIYLSGSDPDPNDTPLIVTVSAVGLTGRLFQFNANTGGRGNPITGSNVRVLDNLFRVIYTTQSGAKSTGAVDVVQYVVSDTAGLTDSGQVNITLPNNNLPVANAVSSYTIPEDTHLTIYLTGSDVDDPNNTFSAYANPPSRGTLYQSDGVTAIQANNTLVTASDNKVIFVPGQFEFGNPSSNYFYTSFSYYVVSQNTSQQSNPATLSISVTFVNHLPRFAITNVQIPQNTYSTVNISSFDPDGDQFVVRIRYATGATLSLFQVNPNGSKGVSLTYDQNSIANLTNANHLLGVTPATGFVGTISPEFSLCDWSGCTGFTFISIQVFYVALPPIATGGTFTFQQPLQAGYISIGLDFSDPNDFPVRVSTLTGTIVRFPAIGKLYRTNIISPTYEITPQNPTFAATATNQVYYAPGTFSLYGNNFSNFTWFISDETNLTSPVSTTIINVTPPCSQPASVFPQGGGRINTTAGVGVTFTFSVTDDDPTDLFFVISTQPQHGTLYTRGDFQQNPSTAYPNQNLASDLSNMFDLQIFTLNNQNTLFYVDYVPAAGYSSFGVGPDCFQYQYLTCSANGAILWPEVFQACFYVQDVNTAPTISLTSSSFTSGTGGLTITGVSVNDDSLNFPIKVTLTGTNANSVSVVNPASVTYQQTSATSAQLTGTVSALNNALASGIQFVPSSLVTATLQVSVNDQGFYSEVNQGAGTPLTASATITITVSSGKSLQSGPGAVTGVFIGGTSIVSSAVYGVYRTLRSKKVLPEEADPWANDADYDATDNNPLYGGTGSTPIYSSSL